MAFEDTIGFASRPLQEALICIRERRGSWYAEELSILGLVEHSKSGEWILTPKGQKVVERFGG